MGLADIDLSPRISEREYEEKLRRLQLELLDYQYRIIEEKVPVILVFEGWDASGKGGAIRRLTEQSDPRTYRVHPIGAPTPEEMRYHYLRRFWARLPRRGQIGIFDRSWYGRVLVERVEKLCSKKEWQRAYEEINGFEQVLVDDGTLLIKFFLHISKEEQLQRFKDREKSPWKRWKITDEDWRNREKWDRYEEAIEEMLAKTHTKHAPWQVIAGEQKKYARIQVLQIVLEHYQKVFGK
ncbi:polyphosphate kinase 2 family protein [Heliophilum fasciatum]|uniref:Polyphosphate:AMP phosphotransferase n=1 Tax=Heliophilum fasciatum TaxID=35700 RepID=A0A4R2RPH0_9FIRM|nr:UDP-galactose-lipid carrier transferase [Heliophilum fasciatum]MCW2277599.1 polyphosphate kinase 2 (PPK2 family) [Heliophilum fasciatum]TCP64948.1 polyphosphate:AMP phosphotransferase [Heliophilum fasciatum]